MEAGQWNETPQGDEAESGENVNTDWVQRSRHVQVPSAGSRMAGQASADPARAIDASTTNTVPDAEATTAMDISMRAHRCQWPRTMLWKWRQRKAREGREYDGAEHAGQDAIFELQQNATEEQPIPVLHEAPVARVHVRQCLREMETQQHDGNQNGYNRQLGPRRRR